MKSEIENFILNKIQSEPFSICQLSIEDILSNINLKQKEEITEALTHIFNISIHSYLQGHVFNIIDLLKELKVKDFELLKERLGVLLVSLMNNIRQENGQDLVMIVSLCQEMILELDLENVFLEVVEICYSFSESNDHKEILIHILQEVITDPQSLKVHLFLFKLLTTENTHTIRIKCIEAIQNYINRMNDAQKITQMFSKYLEKICLSDPSSRVRYCSLEYLSHINLNIDKFCKDILYIKCFDKDKKVRCLAWTIIERLYGECLPKLTSLFSSKELRKLLEIGLTDDAISKDIPYKILIEVMKDKGVLNIMNQWNIIDKWDIYKNFFLIHTIDLWNFK